MRFCGLLLLMCLTFGCAEDDTAPAGPEVTIDPATAFTFGLYGGFCAEPCDRFYRFTGDTLQRASAYPGWRPGDDLDFVTTAFGAPGTDQTIYEERAIALRDALPALLVDNSASEYCCSGIADGSTVYLEAYPGDTLRWWTIEIWEGELADYSSQVYEVVGFLED